MTRILRIVDKVFIVLAAVCLIVVALSVLYTVAMRFMTGSSPNWSFDLSMLMMLPLTFLVAGPVAREKGHVSVDVIVDTVPPVLGHYLELAGKIIAALFVVYLTYISWQRFLAIFESGQVTGSAYIPHWPAALTVPIGLFVMALVLVLDVVDVVSTALSERRAA